MCHKDIRSRSSDLDYVAVRRNWRRWWPAVPFIALGKTTRWHRVHSQTAKEYYFQKLWVHVHDSQWNTTETIIRRTLDYTTSSCKYIPLHLLVTYPFTYDQTLIISEPQRYVINTGPNSAFSYTYATPCSKALCTGIFPRKTA